MTALLRKSSQWTLGFVGTGKISSAVATGFCTLDSTIRPQKIYVSERSAEKSKALKESFPNIIEVLPCNKEIVRNSDAVFVGLLPEVAREVLPTLPWDEKCKLIVSMMASMDHNEVWRPLSV
jgi:pyrroline-5-carboxylate reductase